MPEFQVLKNDIAQTRIAPAPETPLETGQVRARIDRFSFTANNITYGQVGDQMRYWDFFPAAQDSETNWGIIPVWGFADIVESTHPDVPVGDRIYGYFPPSTSLVMQPERVSESRFVDATAHRIELPSGYNGYQRVRAEVGYEPKGDDLRALLWPLLITSFCLWDAAQAADWFGAEQILVLSASSKTSIGLAYALADDATSPKVIGLTSARNLAKVAKLDLYDDVLSYDAIDAIDASVPTLIIDMSGNGHLLARLHTMLGAQMRQTINVGLTHREEIGKQPGFIVERSEFFFAPGHIQKRLGDWGPAGFQERTQNYLMETTRRIGAWLEVHHLDGLDDLRKTYPEILSGRLDADRGIVAVMPD